MTFTVHGRRRGLRVARAMSVSLLEVLTLVSSWLGLASVSADVLYEFHCDDPLCEELYPVEAVFIFRDDAFDDGEAYLQGGETLSFQVRAPWADVMDVSLVDCCLSSLAAVNFAIVDADGDGVVEAMGDVEPSGVVVDVGLIFEHQPLFPVTAVTMGTHGLRMFSHTGASAELTGSWVRREPAAEAALRFANGTPSAASLRLDAEVSLSVPSDEAASFLRYSTGLHRVQVVDPSDASNVLAEWQVRLPRAGSWTLALLGGEDAGTLVPALFEDERQSSSSHGKLRVVHAAPGASQLDAVIADGPTLADQLSVGEASEVSELLPGTVDVEVFDSGTQEQVGSLHGLEIRAGVNVSVFWVTGRRGTDLVAFVTEDVNDRFLRGDANRDGRFDLSDPIATLTALFIEPAEHLCLDAADVEDDGAVTLTDAVYALDFLFRSGPAPVEPYPVAGTDSTADMLGCTSIPR